MHLTTMSRSANWVVTPSAGCLFQRMMCICDSGGVRARLGRWAASAELGNPFRRDERLTPKGAPDLAAVPPRLSDSTSLRACLIAIGNAQAERPTHEGFCRQQPNNTKTVCLMLMLMDAC